MVLHSDTYILKKAVTDSILFGSGWSQIDRNATEYERLELKGFFPQISVFSENVNHWWDRCCL